MDINVNQVFSLLWKRQRCLWGGDRPLSKPSTDAVGSGRKQSSHQRRPSITMHHCSARMTWPTLAEVARPSEGAIGDRRFPFIKHLSDAPERVILGSTRFTIRWLPSRQPAQLGSVSSFRFQAVTSKTLLHWLPKHCWALVRGYLAVLPPSQSEHVLKLVFAVSYKNYHQKHR